jgi:hypothetical protein
MTFSKRQFRANDAYADTDYAPGTHMFLKVTDIRIKGIPALAICVQSNTSSKTTPPLIQMVKSVFKGGGRGSHISVTDLYVMLDDMALSWGRAATDDELESIHAGIAGNIQNLRFYMIDLDLQYELVTDKTDTIIYTRLVEKALKHATTKV